LIKHIVMWKLKESAEGADKTENALKIKYGLEALKGKVETVKTIEVGININTTEAAYDVVLYSEFDCPEDLGAYQKHPEHVKVANFISKVRELRTVVDYEC